MRVSERRPKRKKSNPREHGRGNNGQIQKLLNEGEKRNPENGRRGSWIQVQMVARMRVVAA